MERGLPWFIGNPCGGYCVINTNGLSCAPVCKAKGGGGGFDLTNGACGIVAASDKPSSPCDAFPPQTLCVPPTLIHG
jgi:hypothetical protein